MVRQAVVCRRAVKKAARVSLSSAVVTLAIGALAILFLLFSLSWSGVFVTVGICAVGMVEFLGHKRIKQAQPSAARLLGFNQLVFIGVITIYCAAQMIGFSTEQAKSAALSGETRSQLQQMPEMAASLDKLIEKWAPIAVYGLYGLVILASIVGQGALALYYFTRRRHIEAFNRQTPAWIRRLFIEMQI
jgi:hypothetical protein